MDWISVKDKMPDCWSQHGHIFASGYVLTYAVYCDDPSKFDKLAPFGEIEVNQYAEYGKHTSNGWIKERGEWELEGSDKYVTHWMPLPKRPTFEYTGV